jgi:3',5'-cyclic AMP phosphodiesterase CpdA
MGRNVTALNNAYIRFPFLRTSTWYYKIIDSTAIIFLNSNDGDLTKEQAQDQIDWYKATLDALEKNSAILYIISVCHHPPFTNSTLVSRSSYILKNFVPIFVRNTKTIAFFSGHCHSYEHFVYKGKTFIVSGGGGGPRQTVETGHNGSDMPADLYNGYNPRLFNYCKYYMKNGKPFIQVIGMSKETGVFQTMDEFRLQ